MDRAGVERMVREVLARHLGPTPGPQSEPLGFVAEADVLAAQAGGRLWVAPGALVTPLARDCAARLRVELVTAQGAATGEKPPSPVSVAIGADHGGVKLKSRLLLHLRETQREVLDVGTHGTDPVDYPDIAHQVAREVASGRASFGILVDTVGVGSCMAANRHRGVRAVVASGWVEVRNSREHNDANVLCLGGGMVADSLACQLADLFLTTAHGGGRHARRVAKIEPS